MSDTRDGVRIDTRDTVLEIVLDRPERKNALGPGGIGRIVDALEAGSTDDSLRVVTFRSSGDDFCSGADWVARNTKDAPKPRTGSIQRRVPVEAHRFIELVYEIQLPVVCEVRGWAAGLGCQLAVAADFTVASETSRFWEPFLQRGFTPDSGATWLLPRLVGVARAKEMLLLGRELSGREAADWGLIHRAAPDEQVGTVFDELVGRLAGAATTAFGLTKRSIHRGLTTGLKDAMEVEANALELSSRSPDFREGLAAFRERRDPDFQGR